MIDININKINKKISIQTNNKIIKIAHKETVYYVIFKPHYNSFKINKNIFQSNRDSDNDSFLIDLIISNNFIDAIIKYNNIEITIILSIDSSHLNLFEKNEKIIFHTDEFLFKKSIDLNSTILSLNTKHSYWLPTGINNTKKILPGSLTTYRIYPNFKLTKSKLIFNFEKFNTEDNHIKNVDDIIKNFEVIFDDYAKISNKWELLLSSGLDSAILFLFAEAKNLNFNINSYVINNDETIGASRITELYKKKLSKFYRASPINPNNEFSIKTDLNHYLEHIKPLIENTFSHNLFNNIPLEFSYKHKSSFVLDGSVYPTALCCQHFTAYPYYLASGFEKFKPYKNYNKRLGILKNYKDTSLLNEEYKKFFIKYLNDVDERYFNTLIKIFSGTPKLDDNSYFVSNALNIENHLSMNDGINDRGKKIIEYLKNYNILNYLKNFSEEKNLSLQKMLILINHISKASKKSRDLTDTNYLKFYRPGTNSNLIEKLLNIKYDKKLIEYPKWHLFQVFKKISGKNFFEINEKKYLFFEGKNKIKKLVNRYYYKKNFEKDFFYNLSLQHFIKTNYLNEIEFILNTFNYNLTIDQFFKSNIDFETKSKIINIAGLLKNNKVDF